MKELTAAVKSSQATMQFLQLTMLQLIATHISNKVVGKGTVLTTFTSSMNKDFWMNSRQLLTWKVRSNTKTFMNE